MYPVRQVSRCVAARVRANGFDDFAIRQEWWSGEALPEAKVVRRELAGVPSVEVVGLSRRRWRRCFWDTITQVRAELAGSPGNDLRYFVRRVE